MRIIRKLRLSRETLSRLDAQRSSPINGDRSCVESCYLVSCDGGCTISTGVKGE